MPHNAISEAHFNLQGSGLDMHAKQWRLAGDILNDIGGMSHCILATAPGHGIVVFFSDGWFALIWPNLQGMLLRWHRPFSLGTFSCWPVLAAWQGQLQVCLLSHGHPVRS